MSSVSKSHNFLFPLFALKVNHTIAQICRRLLWKWWFEALMKNNPSSLNFDLWTLLGLNMCGVWISDRIKDSSEYATWIWHFWKMRGLNQRCWKGIDVPWSSLQTLKTWLQPTLSPSPVRKKGDPSLFLDFQTAYDHYGQPFLEWHCVRQFFWKWCNNAPQLQKKNMRS